MKESLSEFVIFFSVFIQLIVDGCPYYALYVVKYVYIYMQPTSEFDVFLGASCSSAALPTLLYNYSILRGYLIILSLFDTKFDLHRFHKIWSR